MTKIAVLHLGIKYWPLTEALNLQNGLRGIRGGGMNKYCDLLINNFNDGIKTVIICQKLKGQVATERSGNITTYRMNTIGSRAIRQILMSIFSFFLSLKIIRNEKIDIIHGHMHLNIFIAFWLGKIFNKPVVATPYSFVTMQMNLVFNKIAKFIELKYYQKVDILVFESEENRQKALILRGLSFPNSVVIHTGIPIPKLNSGLRTKNEVVNLLYLGRLVEVKAVDKLILSFLYINPELLKVIHLNIVGEGEEYNELKRLIETNNLSSNITLHGFIEDCSKMFINSDIFVLPSYQEGLSVALLEAMSYGLACIINNFGVPFNKNTVFVIPNNSPKVIAKAITEVISDKVLLAQLKRDSRLEIKKLYTANKFAQEYLQVYRSVLTAHHQQNQHKLTRSINTTNWK